MLLLSCKKEAVETTTENNTDMNTTTKQTPDNHVKGPEGYLHVIDDESKRNPAIVFAHSFGGSSEHWKNQMQYLRHSYRVVAFDFRSHGKSDSSAHQLFTAEALAGDIAAVVDSLDLKNFILVGHSMGGAASIAYANANPERVSGLVLVGTPGKTPKEQSIPIIASLESDKYQMVMDQYMKTLLADAKHITDTIVMHDVKKISRETSINIIKALFEYDPLPAMRDLKMPVLIVSTSREKSQPNALMNQMPKVSNRVFDGTSHWIQMDKPQEFNTVLDDFVMKVDKDSLVQSQ
jgi:pimeloyl-ACP methyl ester carboxylesterase